jgi:hypothetical protein
MNKITILFLLSVVCIQNSFSQTFEKTFVTPNSTLNGSYDMVYAPDGFLWMTERLGKKIRRYNLTTNLFDDLIDLTTIVYQTGGQDGLLGFVLHPNFGLGTSQDFVYVAYT